MQETTEIPVAGVLQVTAHYTVVEQAVAVLGLPESQLKAMPQAAKVATEWLATLAEH
jgi:hypothetical protein